nr:MAG TPA: hypothetical protein [Caudoviricetes sp.]
MRLRIVSAGARRRRRPWPACSMCLSRLGFCLRSTTLTSGRPWLACF